MADGGTSIGASDAGRIAARYQALDGLALVRAMIEEAFPGRIALVSSFGAEAAVLLDLVARIDPATPVLFLETGKHFAETIEYRRALARHIGLRDVRDVRPDPGVLAARDPDGTLSARDPDGCCDIRKVRPLARALAGFDAWFTGRKRFHGGERETLPGVEVEQGRVKINPLANWRAADIDRYYLARGLPRHPLHADGYLSIGCEVCTRPLAEGEDIRAGRWAGAGKTECGIHGPNRPATPGAGSPEPMDIVGR